MTAGDEGRRVSGNPRRFSAAAGGGAGARCAGERLPGGRGGGGCGRDA